MGIYCSKCGEEMSQGYNVHDGLYHYCSKECLNLDICDMEYDLLYEEGYAFWTTFED